MKITYYQVSDTEIRTSAAIHYLATMCFVMGIFLGAAYLANDTVHFSPEALEYSFWLWLVFWGVGVWLFTAQIRIFKLMKSEHFPSGMSRKMTVTPPANNEDCKMKIKDSQQLKALQVQVENLKADLNIYVTTFEYSEDFKHGGLIQGWMDSRLIINSRKLLDRKT